MAKNQTYDDDLLLEAVEQYNEVEKGRLTYTGLAKWAGENIPGLEGVEDRHFSRPMEIKNPTTGKIEKIEKQCAKRFEELKKERNFSKASEHNELLHANNPLEFFELSRSAQVRLIKETRQLFFQACRACTKLENENSKLQIQNERLTRTAENVGPLLEKIESMQRNLDKKLTYWLNVVEELQRKEVLAEIGIEDGKIDLLKRNKSLEDTYTELFCINDQLKKFRKFEHRVEENSSPNDYSEIMNWTPTVEDE